MYKAKSIEMGIKLAEAGLVERGMRVKNCSSKLVVRYCRECGNVHITGAELCRDRMCPVCNWRLSLKRYAVMSNVMQSVMRAYPEAVYSFVTLTARNCKTARLKEYMTEMQTAYNRVISQKWARKSLIGWGRSIELTYNQAAKTVHPHYHIILVSDSTAVAPMFVAEWLKQTEKRGIRASEAAQDISIITAEQKSGESEHEALTRAVVETFKYAVKTKSLDDLSGRELRTFAQQIAGKRLMSAGGVIKEYLAILDEDIENPDEKEFSFCTECKSDDIAKAVAAWSISAGTYTITEGDELPKVIKRKIEENFAKQLENRAKWLETETFSMGGDEA